MIEYKTNEFTWFLEDEGSIPVIKDIAHPEGKRRSYGVCEHSGKKLFIKTFSEKGISGRVRSLISPRGKKEFIIASKLKRSKVPAPIPVGYGVGARTSAIAEYFINGKTFLEIFENSPDRDSLLRQLADFLRLLTNAHVRHDDLHLDNILVSGDIFYLVDLHKAKVRRSFSEDDELANLTHALGMIYYDLSPGERDTFFARYQPRPAMKKDLEKAIRSLREKWVLNKMARAFRDTSIVHREGTKLSIRGREECGRGGFVEIIKNDRKIKVERYGDHIRKTYIPQHRLKTAWKNHVVLEYMQKMITPVVYNAEIPKTGHGYIAMEDLRGRGEELDRHLDRNYDAMDIPERREFINGLADFFLGVMAWAITHRDLKACNIFVLGRGGFLFLDVEDIQFTSATPDTLKKAFCQLNNTVPKRISAQDRMRFYLRLVSLVDCDKKRLFKDIITESLKDNIVYEGISGLVVDSWK
ncbi:MAG: Lipopolysaccharide kinase (Kdo/WaaP) family [Deltaproteobacteria bacterium]|nr:Lipopolysaccharide kinase (Kdo/WaaP) family [Deltaproteobacteria bacterium]